MELPPQATSAAPLGPIFPDLNVDAFLRFASNPRDTSAVSDIQKRLVASPRRAEMFHAGGIREPVSHVDRVEWLSEYGPRGARADSRVFRDDSQVFSARQNREALYRL